MSIRLSAKEQENSETLLRPSIASKQSKVEHVITLSYLHKRSYSMVRDKDENTGMHGVGTTAL